MLEAKEINFTILKEEISSSILRQLPDWFGLEAAIDEYVQAARDQPFFVAFLDANPVGFLALRQHNQYTAEIAVMGVLKEHHRSGIGRQLVNQCQLFCQKNKLEFLTVKTLDSSRQDSNYEKTRRFYTAMGFKPLEVLPLYWDKENPCLIMIKHLYESY